MSSKEFIFLSSQSPDWFLLNDYSSNILVSHILELIWRTFTSTSILKRTIMGLVITHLFWTRLNYFLTMKLDMNLSLLEPELICSFIIALIHLNSPVVSNLLWTVLFPHIVPGLTVLESSLFKDWHMTGFWIVSVT